MVIDFGIAKAIKVATEPEQALTDFGTSPGTPAYMSPEQGAASSKIDHRADIYSLGCVAYEMLAGRTPFVAASREDLHAAHMAENPLPLSVRAPAVPAWLATVVMQCLEKDPNRRPSSANDVLVALERARPVASPWHRSVLVRGSGVAAIIALSAAIWTSFRTGSSALDSNVVAVLPFRVTGPDSSYEYLREGAVDLRLIVIASLCAISPIPAQWRRRSGK